MSKENIKIFLASSEELVEDRKEFEEFLYRKTKSWSHKNIFLELIIWEDFLDSISPTRKQDDYNRAIEECDIFVLLFFMKIGKYTEEEFDIAYQQFKATRKPIIFTYFKSAPIDSDEIDERVLSMLDFKKRLAKLKHFYSKYETIDSLKLHFSQQLDKLERENFLLNEENDRLLIYLSSGGTCRDPMAKVITLKLIEERSPQLNLRVEGMALGPPTKTVVSYAARNAIKDIYGDDLLADYVPIKVTNELLDKADLVLVMAHSLWYDKFLPKTKTYVFKEFFGLEGDIEDPYPDGRDKDTLSRYKETAAEIKTILENNFDRLLEAIQF